MRRALRGRAASQADRWRRRRQQDAEARENGAAARLTYTTAEMAVALQALAQAGQPVPGSFATDRLNVSVRQWQWWMLTIGEPAMTLTRLFGSPTP